MVGLEAVSDELGNFAIAGVPPGTYRVRFAVPAGYDLVGPARDLITVNGSEIRDLNARFAVDPSRAAPSFADLTSFMNIPVPDSRSSIGRISSRCAARDEHLRPQAARPESPGTARAPTSTPPLMYACEAALSRPMANRHAPVVFKVGMRYTVTGNVPVVKK